MLNTGRERRRNRERLDWERKVEIQLYNKCILFSSYNYSCLISWQRRALFSFIQFVMSVNRISKISVIVFGDYYAFLPLKTTPDFKNNQVTNGFICGRIVHRESSISCYSNSGCYISLLGMVTMILSCLICVCFIYVDRSSWDRRTRWRLQLGVF